MRSPTRRQSAIIAVLGLLAGLVPALMLATPANAASVTTQTGCSNSVQAGFSNLPITVSGSASPDPQKLGDVLEGSSTLTDGTFGIDVPGTTLLAGYGLGLLTAGPTASSPSATNVIPAIVNVTLEGSNTVESSATFATYPGDDGFVSSNPLTPDVDESLDNTFGPDGPGISVVGTTVIVDPTPSNKTSGDETATDLSVSAPIPTTTWTGIGGTISLRLGSGSSKTTALLSGGALEVGFTCTPGTLSPTGCELLPPVSPPTPPNCNGVTPVPAVPFDTITVLAPPTAPVCVGESVSVGAGQPTTIDLRNNCTDVNENIDPTTFAVGPLSIAPPPGGTLAPTGTNGVYTYTAPVDDPGLVTFDFTVSDSTAAVDGGPKISNTAKVSITVLANQCDATVASCSLTEIIVQPVEGSTMKFDKAPLEVIMSPVQLNGQAQVSQGAIKEVTVTNARGSATAWNVTGYVTDLGNASSPRVVAGVGITIPACSNAGSFGGVLTSDGTPAGVPGNLPDRNCIPGDNLAWSPSAAIAHSRIAGDVAHVTAGSPHASSAADWLTQLITAGGAAPASATPPPTVPGPDGLGGLQGQRNLCGAPVNQSGGTFRCNAALYLGIPASAGAGIYGGGLVLTLL